MTSRARSMCGAVLLTLTLGLAGCAEPTPSADPADFRTDFTRIGEKGFIDLSLDFTNPTRHPITLHGRLVARDAGNAELSDVKVTTAFGTEAGRALVMPGGSIDFVQFRGPGSKQVRDVTFEDVSASEVDLPVTSGFVEIFPLDGHGDELEYDSFAHQVRLQNSDAEPAKVRVVLMALGTPQPGDPQQAILVRDVTTVEVEGNAAETVGLDAETRSILRKRGRVSFVTLRSVVAP